jgi:hypothetical protein
MTPDELPALPIPGISVQCRPGDAVCLVLPVDCGPDEVRHDLRGAASAVLVLQDPVQQGPMLPISLSFRDARAADSTL